jgi:hypothetical protein
MRIKSTESLYVGGLPKTIREECIASNILRIAARVVGNLVETNFYDDGIDHAITPSGAQVERPDIHPVRAL